MESRAIGLILLSGLFPPVSCTDSIVTSPVTCYMLDGILIVYSLIATALFFREKFSALRSRQVEVPENDEGDYQVLQATTQLDPYEVLEPSKRKKHARRKKKTQAAGAAGSEMTPAENRARPLSPH